MGCVGRGRCSSVWDLRSVLCMKSVGWRGRYGARGVCYVLCMRSVECMRSVGCVGCVCVRCVKQGTVPYLAAVSSVTCIN